MADRTLETLKKHWGYDSFRPLQRSIIDSVMAGKDTLGLMPTGGGKSLTFQVPAMMLPGLTLVVTPLISLMKDQVDNLKARHIGAALLHSGMTRTEQQNQLTRCQLGRVKLLYISPERLSNPLFTSMLRSIDVSLLVVDEAHCISQWGYDFRPSYLKISDIRRQLPEVPVLALTATATPEVTADIRLQLGFPEDAPTFSMSFERPNISYLVRRTEAKGPMMVRILRNTRGPAIVYVRSRRRTRELAEMLNDSGLSADFYHAGLDPSDKNEKQNHWKEDKVRIMVATNAFGMGIDKPDVRTVVHYDIPPSLEEYYQEAGRAGRDGEESYAVVLVSKSDKAVLSRRLSASFPEKDFIRGVYEKACVFINLPVGEGYNHLYDFNPEAFITRFNLPPTETYSALRLLSRAGWWEFVEEGDSSARVMMLATRQELYSHPLTPQGDKLLQALLRTYTGLFADYVPISEVRLSGPTQMTPNEIYQTFLYLTREHILHYIPRRTTPALFFTTSREETRRIQLPLAVYEHQRERMHRRIEAVKEYVYSDGGDGCRVARMLAWFGEKNPKPCGKCDDCRSRRGTSASTNKKEIILHAVSQHPEGIGMEALSRQTGLPPERLAREIRLMADEHLLSINHLTVTPLS